MRSGVNWRAKLIKTERKLKEEEASKEDEKKG